MGSPNYTIQEAAGRLGKTRRMIYNYIEKGFLSRYQEGPHVMVSKEDVEMLAVELASEAPVVNRQTFFRLTTRVKTLENEMKAVLHALEMRSNVLRPTTPEALGFHRAVTDSLTRRGEWSLDEIKLWAQQFEQIDELTLEVICRSAQDNQAWVPFYQLCLAMLEFVRRKHQTKADLEWQKILIALENGRVKMRAGVIILIEMGKGVSTETLLGLAETPKDAILAKLKA